MRMEGKGKSFGAEAEGDALVSMTRVASSRVYRHVRVHVHRVGRPCLRRLHVARKSDSLQKTSVKHDCSIHGEEMLLVTRNLLSSTLTTGTRRCHPSQYCMHSTHH